MFGVKKPIVIINDIGPETDWSDALDSVDVVIHLAGLAHQSRAAAYRNHDNFKKVNSDGTYNLVIQAVKKKVHRFIFMSSVIKCHSTII